MPTLRQLTRMAQRAGYHVTAAEQLRPNRWLLKLQDLNGSFILVLVQARPLIYAADVQDLAELVRLQRATRGLLMAYNGAFTAMAEQTLAELTDDRLQLCTVFPPVVAHDSTDLRVMNPALRPAR